MAKNTDIAWTDSTFNGWWGCQKTGPGCDNCYAEKLDKRTGGDHWGPGAPRRRTSVTNWNDPIRWNKKADAFFAEHGRLRRVFCASMADVFDSAVDVLWRDDLFTLIANTQKLNWLLLTKRIGNAKTMLPWMSKYSGPDGQRTLNAWDNVWLGATVVNQTEADRDIPKLQSTPAKKRFLSMEPLLGPVDLTGLLDNIDWVIVGGESGPGARPMHPEWVRSLRDQCKAANVPFLFKQWGEWRPMHLDEAPKLRGMNCHLVSDGSRPTIASGTFHLAHQIQSMISDPQYSWQHPVLKLGAKATGRLLDGVLHDNFPANDVQIAA